MSGPTEVSQLITLRAPSSQPEKVPNTQPLCGVGQARVKGAGCPSYHSRVIFIHWKQLCINDGHTGSADSRPRLVSRINEWAPRAVDRGARWVFNSARYRLPFYNRHWLRRLTPNPMMCVKLGPSSGLMRCIHYSKSEGAAKRGITVPDV